VSCACVLCSCHFACVVFGAPCFWPFCVPGMCVAAGHVPLILPAASLADPHQGSPPFSSAPVRRTAMLWLLQPYAQERTRDLSCTPSTSHTLSPANAAFRPLHGALHFSLGLVVKTQVCLYH
jgi:hypothetical protein